MPQEAGGLKDYCRDPPPARGAPGIQLLVRRGRGESERCYQDHQGEDQECEGSQ